VNPPNIPKFATTLVAFRVLGARGGDMTAMEIVATGPAVAASQA